MISSYRGEYSNKSKCYMYQIPIKNEYLIYIMVIGIFISQYYIIHCFYANSII